MARSPRTTTIQGDRSPRGGQAAAALLALALPLAALRLLGHLDPPPHLSPLRIAIPTEDPLEPRTLPGLGRSIEARLTAWGPPLSPLQGPGDLLRIPGIGPDRLDRWSPHLSGPSSFDPTTSILKPSAPPR